LSESLSIREYARHRGCWHTTVIKALASGRIKKDRKGGINPVQADRDWPRNTGHRILKQKSIKGRGSAPPSSSEIGYSKARAVRETFLARTAQLNYEVQSGVLVKRAEMEAATFNLARTFRDQMLNIPERISAIVAAERDPRNCHDILTAEIRKALISFAKLADPSRA